METSALKDFSEYADSVEKYIFADAFDELFKYTNISARVLGKWLNNKKASCNVNLFLNNEELCKHVINNSNDLNKTDFLILLACRFWKLQALKEFISFKKTLTPREIITYAVNVFLCRPTYYGFDMVDDSKIYEILKYLFSYDESSECSIEYRQLLHYALLYASDATINVILDFMATKKFNLKETLNTEYERKSIHFTLEIRKPTINTATIKRLKELGCEFSFKSWYISKLFDLTYII